MREKEKMKERYRDACNECNYKYRGGYIMKRGRARLAENIRYIIMYTTISRK